MPEMGSSLARAGAGGDTEAQGKRAQAIAGLKAPFRAATGAAHFTGADCMALLGSGNMEANQPIEEPFQAGPEIRLLWHPLPSYWPHFCFGIGGKGGSQRLWARGLGHNISRWLGATSVCVRVGWGGGNYLGTFWAR
jgi:hypothetical protein